MDKPPNSLGKKNFDYEEIQTLKEKRRIHRLGRLFRRPDFAERLADCTSWVVRGLSVLVRNKGK